MFGLPTATFVVIILVPLLIAIGLFIWGIIYKPFEP